MSAFGSVRSVLPFSDSEIRWGVEGRGRPQEVPQTHGSTNAEATCCERLPTEVPHCTEFAEEGYAFALTSCRGLPGKERSSSDTSRRPSFGSAEVPANSWRETPGAKVEVIELDGGDWKFTRPVAGAVAEGWVPLEGTPPACDQSPVFGGRKIGIPRPAL